MRTKNEAIIQAILDYINDEFFIKNSSPSVQKIADKVGIVKSAVSRYLSEMESRGLIFRSNTYYGITTVKIKKAMSNVTRLPIVGDIACGTPLLAEENIESYLTISGDFLGSGNYFVLKANGNSMINVGINDGDYVVVRQQNNADQGQIVVALVNDGECTLKKYYRDNRRRKIRLHPENDDMEDMYFDNIEIQGIAVKVIKNLEN